jgi:HEAT repeat protein
MQSLRGLQSPAALQLIEEAVHTSDGEIRSLAVRTLADTRDPRAVDIVTSALDDSDPSVRENVAYALRTIGGDKARSALLGLSRSADEQDRVAAVQTLRDDGDRSVEQRMTELLRDPSPTVVNSAMYALASSTTGAANLRALVLDGTRPYEMRYQAAMALERLDANDERTSQWLASSGEPDGQ